MYALTGMAWLSTLPFEGAAGAEEKPMVNPIIPHWPEFWWSLVLFLLLWFAIAKYVVPNMEKTYAARRDAIEGDMGRAEKALAEAEAVKAQYESQLTSAREEAARLREEAREQGAAILAEMRGQAQAESARILESAQTQIAAEKAQAMISLRNDMGRLSTDLASRIVGESLQDEVRQKGTVERFLAELEAGEVRPEKVGESRPTGDGQ